MSRPATPVTIQTFALPAPRAVAQHWQTGAPAVGSVLARLAELYARCLRVELERRAQGAERLGRAVRRLPR